jgi:hypothetical protein
MISNRTYQIKNALEHRRFEAGGWSQQLRRKMRFTLR